MNSSDNKSINAEKPHKCIISLIGACGVHQSEEANVTTPKYNSDIIPVTIWYDYI